MTMKFGNMEAINILDKSSFNFQCFMFGSYISDHWWGLLEQLNQLPPESCGLAFEALPPNWTTVVKVGSSILFLGWDGRPFSPVDPLRFFKHITL